MAFLKDLCVVEYGKGLPERYRVAGAAKVLGSAGVVGTHNQSMYNEPIIVVGRKGNISGVHKIDGPSWVIDTAYAIKAGKNIDRDYLYYFLCYNTAHLAASDQSTAIPSLAREVLYSLPLAPPKIDAQIKVVKKIESLFAEVDKGATELDSAKRKIELFRQSILNSAIRGKLVPQDPKDEPASMLLSKIQKEKERLNLAKKIKKEKPLSPISKDEIPFDLQNCWSVTRLGEIIHSQLIGLVRSKEEQNNSHPIKYLKMGDYNEMGELNLNNLTSVVASDEEIQKFDLRKNDVIFNTRNSPELVGKVCLIEQDQKNTVYNNNLMRIRFMDGIYPPYIYFLLSSPMTKSILSQAISATTSVAAIYGGICFHSQFYFHLNLNK